MVNRILKFEAAVAPNAVAEVIDKVSPRQGQTYQVEEIWTAGNPDVEISLSIRERTLIDEVPSDHLPQAGDGLVYDLRVDAGEDLTVLGTETAGGDAQDVAVYVLISEN